MRKHGRYEIAYPAHAPNYDHDRIGKTVGVNGPYLPFVIVLVIVINSSRRAQGKCSLISRAGFPGTRTNRWALALIERNARSSRARAARTIIGLPLRNYDALPKGDAVFDVGGSFFRIRIIPGGIFVYLAAHRDVVIAGQPLPRAGRVRGAFHKMCSVNRIHGEVMIAFNHHGVFALREEGIFPSCFHLCIFLYSNFNPQLSKARVLRKRALGLFGKRRARIGWDKRDRKEKL